MAIKFFDMFAGIGGFRSGLEAIGGFECIGYCEIDKYAKQVYEAMYDTGGELYFEDARKIIPEQLPHIDLITGGFPCQSFFQLQDKGKDLKIPEERCSLKLQELLPLKDLSICSLKMYPDCLVITKAGHLKQSSVRWTNWGMMSYGKCLTAKISEFRNPEKRLYIIGFHREKCAGQVLSFTQTNSKTTVQRYPGKEGDRIYSSEGTSITLTSNAGGFGGRTGLYSIEEFGLPIKVNTKDGYQIAYPGDSIDTAFWDKIQGVDELETKLHTPLQHPKLRHITLLI